MVIAGEGLSISSISFRAGIGVGGGFSFDPAGGSPDQKAADSCESANGIGVYAEASGTVGIIGAGVGANYGATQSFDSKGRLQYSEYKGVTPASQLAPTPRAGAQLQFGFGLEATRYLERQKKRGE